MFIKHGIMNDKFKLNACPYFDEMPNVVIFIFQTNIFEVIELHDV